MAYIWIQNQIWRNNNWSLFLLASFPVLTLWLTWLFFFLINYWGEYENIEIANHQFNEAYPLVLLWVLLWFVVAYFFHTSMIKSAVWAKNVLRKDNIELYNLLENLCMSQWMKMPKLQVIKDSSLNAFASWINDSTYAITLSTGLVEKLNRDELEWVIAHELSHIKNKDTQLLVISIIFVWIFSFLAQLFLRSMTGSSRWSSKKSWWGKFMLVWLGLSAVWYLFSLLIRFSISRKREYLADAGSAEMTRKPKALASALKKISWDPMIEALSRKDLASAFIENPQPVSNLLNPHWMLSTHPPINKRISILENF